MSEVSNIIEVKCAACLSQNQISQTFTVSNYTALKCKNCGFVQTTPMPNVEDLFEFYQKFQFCPPSLASLRSEIHEVAQSLSFLIGRSTTKNASILDYGGGCGIFSSAAQSIGLNPTLFDYDLDSVNFAKNKLLIDKASNDWKEISQKRYDYIFLYHVVEHWNNIDNNIIKLLNVLKDDGLIVMVTPNAKSIEKWGRPRHFINYFRKWKKRGSSPLSRIKSLIPTNSFFCWDPPRHLFAFTQESFQEIGKRFNLKTETFVGYNVNPLFEPRGYIIKPIRFRKILSLMKQRKIQTARNVFSEYLSYNVLKILEKVFPYSGDQLVVRFKKN